MSFRNFVFRGAEKEVSIFTRNPPTGKVVVGSPSGSVECQGENVGSSAAKVKKVVSGSAAQSVPPAQTVEGSIGLRVSSRRTVAHQMDKQSSKRRATSSPTSKAPIMRKTAKTAKGKLPSATSKGEALRIVDEASDTEESNKSVKLEMLMPSGDCTEYLSKAIPAEWDEVMEKMSPSKLASLFSASLLHVNALGCVIKGKYVSEVIRYQDENDVLSVKYEDQQAQLQMRDAEIVKLKRELKELEPIRVASWEVTALKAELSKVKESEAELLKHNEDLVVKVIPHVAMTFLKSDEVGQLMGKVVGAANDMGRWKAMEEAAATGKPVVLEDLSGYVADSEMAYDVASNEYASISSSAYLNDVIAKKDAGVEELLQIVPPKIDPPTL